MVKLGEIVLVKAKAGSGPAQKMARRFEANANCPKKWWKQPMKGWTQAPRPVRNKEAA
jgi:hypothetical protein